MGTYLLLLPFLSPFSPYPCVPPAAALAGAAGRQHKSMAAQTHFSYTVTLPPFPSHLSHYLPNTQSEDNWQCVLYPTLRLHGTGFMPSHNKNSTSCRNRTFPIMHTKTCALHFPTLSPSPQKRFSYLEPRTLVTKKRMGITAQTNKAKTRVTPLRCTDSKTDSDLVS